ncbi:HET-domain-containing protein [Xylariaceae sp. AK1471]|nr:HET-domain-containing protein [Xylariaceae sp. AK1471]
MNGSRFLPVILFKHLSDICFGFYPGSSTYERNMRLLNTESLRLQFFMPGQTPDYVILSHLWADEEILFEDFTKHGTIDPDIPVTRKKGFSKVEEARKLAARDGYEWIWIDTCCIDKSSSAELQEAINSMWQYYARSNICYAFMADIPNAQTGRTKAFGESKWFTRGWTLQELIAPTSVEFYAGDWAPIGTKSERYDEISEITKINLDVLTHMEPIDAFSAAERLSWAAHRQVTREEDETYCLLGIFEVNMPMLYGEGRHKAFIRLQEAIYSSTRDDSLFLFRYSPHENDQPLLADSPACFCQDPVPCSLCSGSRGILALPHTISYNQLMPASNWCFQSHEIIWGTITSSRNEMTTTLALLDYQDTVDKLVSFQDSPPPETTHVAVLNHTLAGHPTGALCLLLFRPPEAEGVAFSRLLSFPAFLPCTEEIVASLKPRRILICAGPSHLVKNICLGSVTYFVLNSESFHVRYWHSRGVSQKGVVAIEDSPNTEFQVKSSLAEGYEKSAKVSLWLDGDAAKPCRIGLHLAWIGRSWSIKEVSEFRYRRKKRIHNVQTKTRLARERSNSARKLFSSQVLCDRCSVCTFDGTKLSVALRRLAAPSLPSGIKPFRYQIVVERLETDEEDNKPQ